MDHLASIASAKAEMIGRLFNKARKEREAYELRQGAREVEERYQFEQRIRKVVVERMIDTPGFGYLRFECICGHKSEFGHVDRGASFDAESAGRDVNQLSGREFDEDKISADEQCAEKQINCRSASRRQRDHGSLGQAIRTAAEFLFGNAGAWNGGRVVQSREREDYVVSGGPDRLA